MISVIIARKADGAWNIETWLMSCRVLGRGVEQAALNELADHVLHAGGSKLIGIYRPTDRNQMVADHYKKLGFASLGTQADGSSTWALDLSAYAPADVPIKVLRTGTFPT
jgi:predicted enzyme involved in methoxymalonyl-ACP biosynthesis